MAEKSVVSLLADYQPGSLLGDKVGPFQPCDLSDILTCERAGRFFLSRPSSFFVCDPITKEPAFSWESPPLREGSYEGTRCYFVGDPSSSYRAGPLHGAVLFPSGFELISEVAYTLRETLRGASDWLVGLHLSCVGEHIDKSIVRTTPIWCSRDPMLVVVKNDVLVDGRIRRERPVLPDGRSLKKGYTSP